MKNTFRTTDFRELLARKDVDAVMISTPDHWHVPMALAAIKAGKDIALEKPIGLSIAHGRVLADAAAKSKIVFRTDSNWRSEPELFRVASLVRTGKIGQLKRIRFAVPIYPVPIPNEATMPAPKALDYEMWQGPAERRPLHGRPCSSLREDRAARLVQQSPVLRRSHMQLGTPSSRPCPMGQ